MSKSKRKYIPIKHKDMALENWTTPVEVFDNFESFPSIGNADHLYVDASTSSSEDLHDADMYEWKVDEYATFVGHRPHRPPQS